MLASIDLQKTLVLAGHSHIVCFGIDNSTDGATRLIELQKRPPVYGVQAPWERRDDFLQSVCSLAAGKRLAVLYFGWNRFLFAPNPLFDFVASEFPPLPLESGARVLPEAF